MFCFNVKFGCFTCDVWCALTRRNILPVGSGDNYLKNCTFDPHSHHSLYCPIFSLKYIVDHIQSHGNNFTKLSTQVGLT